MSKLALCGATPLAPLCVLLPLPPVPSLPAPALSLASGCGILPPTIESLGLITTLPLSLELARCSAGELGTCTWNGNPPRPSAPLSALLLVPPLIPKNFLLALCASAPAEYGSVALSGAAALCLYPSITRPGVRSSCPGVSGGVAIPKVERLGFGETGGERGGRFEIGEGGTKWKDSRMESPPPVAFVAMLAPDARLCSVVPPVPVP